MRHERPNGRPSRRAVDPPEGNDPSDAVRKTFQDHKTTEIYSNPETRGNDKTLLVKFTGTDIISGSDFLEFTDAGRYKAIKFLMADDKLLCGEKGRVRISQKGITLDPQTQKKILKNYESVQTLGAGSSGDVFEVKHKGKGSYAWKINEVTERYDTIDNTAHFQDELIASLAVTGHKNAPKLKKAIIEPSGPRGKITTHLMMEVLNKPAKGKYSKKQIALTQEKIKLDTGIQVNDRIHNDPFERTGADDPVEIDYGDVTFDRDTLLDLLRNKAERTDSSTNIVT